MCSIFSEEPATYAIRIRRMQKSQGRMHLDWALSKSAGAEVEVQETKLNFFVEIF